MIEFETAGQAIGFSKRKNPARAKRFNLLEVSFGARSYVDPLDENNPARVFAAVVNAIAYAEESLDETAKRAIRLLFDHDMHPDMVALEIGKNRATVYRMRARFLDRLERILVSRGLMHEQDADAYRHKDARENYEQHKREQAAKAAANPHLERRGKADRIVYRS